VVIVVDGHAHAMPADWLAAVRFPHVSVRSGAAGYTVAFCDGPPSRPVAAGLLDLGRRGEWLAAQGVDRQVIGGWLDLFGYSLPGDEGADWAAQFSAALRSLSAADPRLTALGTVPLQDPVRAAAAVAGPGVMIATRAAGRELDDPAFTPFWEAADDAGAVVFLHPGFRAASERYADFGLVNGLARIEDSTVTLARLLYAGIPARYPRMKLVVAHGGGALPYVLGRLVRNHLLDPRGTADPLESFGFVYFDSVVSDPAALEFLVAKAGADHVLLGSDYPFPIGDLTPREVVARARLTDAERDLILGGTAAKLFWP
jgi:aminocarboxymuconate-semialdehyde decarboxylase